MSTTIYQWKYFCESDMIYKYIWAPDQPVVCAYNSLHAISVSPGPEIVDSVTQSSIIKITEEDGATQGIYKLQGYSLHISEGPSGNVTTTSHVWPYPITLLNGWFHSSVLNLNDKIEASVADGTIVGVITDPVYIGNSEILVSPSVISNVYKGYKIQITDGINLSNLGYISNIENGNNKVYVSSASDSNYSPLTPTYVKISVPLIENFTISVPETRYAFAEKKIGGKYLPPGTPLYIHYTNTNTNSKDWHYNIEMLY